MKSKTILHPLSAVLILLAAFSGIAAKDIAAAGESDEFLKEIRILPDLGRNIPIETSRTTSEIQQLLRRIEEKNQSPGRMPGADRKSLEEQLAVESAREILALRKEIARLQSRTHPYKPAELSKPSVLERGADVSYKRRVDLQEFGIAPGRFSTLAEEYLRTISTPVNVRNIEARRLLEILNDSRNHTSDDPPKIVPIGLESGNKVTVNIGTRGASILDVIDLICENADLKWWIDGDVFVTPRDRIERTFREKYSRE